MCQAEFIVCSLRQPTGSKGRWFCAAAALERSAPRRRHGLKCRHLRPRGLGQGREVGGKSSASIRGDIDRAGLLGPERTARRAVGRRRRGSTGLVLRRVRHRGHKVPDVAGEPLRRDSPVIDGGWEMILLVAWLSIGVSGSLCRLWTSFMPTVSTTRDSRRIWAHPNALTEVSVTVCAQEMMRWTSRSNHANDVDQGLMTPPPRARGCRADTRFRAPSDTVTHDPSDSGSQRRQTRTLNPHRLRRHGTPCVSPASSTHNSDAQPCRRPLALACWIMILDMMQPASPPTSCSPA